MPDHPTDEDYQPNSTQLIMMMMGRVTEQKHT